MAPGDDPKLARCAPAADDDRALLRRDTAISAASASAAPAAPYSYRSDANVPPFPDDRPVFVFDGHCGLCSGWVQFVLRHDRRGTYRLVAAQSPLGQALYVHYGLDPVDFETNLLLVDGVALRKSEASLRMAVGLGFPWSLLRVFLLLPRGLADTCYDWIARNRFRFLGRRAVCYAPRPEYRSRFIESGGP